MLQRAASEPHSDARAQTALGFPLCLALLSALTLVRVIGLKFSIVDLYVDEAQYWAWSRELAAGYFSKPPLLAWIIAGAESVCGASEACLRLPAPLLYLGVCVLIYFIADALYDRRIAFWSALVMALTPGVAFSSRVISTDVPLLFFWALALLAYVKLLRSFDWRWSALLGAALGLGALAKYAMLYFLLGTALAAVLDRDARRLLRTPALFIALVIMAALLAPNLAWNAEHSFTTLHHTGDNIRGAGVAFNPLNGLEFIASQAGLVGPVVFGAFVAALLRAHRPSAAGPDRLMLAFALPPLVLVVATAITTRANANWAAPAMISATIAATAFLSRRGASRWLAASLIIGGGAQGALLVGDAFADRVHIPGFAAKGDLYQRTMGWRALGAETMRLAEEIGAGAIATELRDDIAAIAYYNRDSARPALVWPGSDKPNNHYELTRRIAQGSPEPVLFVSRCPSGTRYAAGYGDVRTLGEFTVASGPSTSRRYFAFRLAEAKPAIGALPPCR